MVQTGSKNATSVIIFNLLGIKQKEVLVELNSGENNIPVDISKLLRGVYFVRIGNSDKILTGIFSITEYQNMEYLSLYVL